MMVNSDNTACDALLARFGGPVAVRENLERLGVQGIRVDRSETEMAVDLLEAARPGSVTARDRASLMALDAGLTVEEREAYWLRYQGDVRDRATPMAMVELLTRFHQDATLKPRAPAPTRALDRWEAVLAHGSGD